MILTRGGKRIGTLQRLLDTAEAIIREKGCVHTTLNDIVERSELSKGAIFHYVKSKDELFALLLNQRLDDIHHRFERAASEERTFAGPFAQITAKLGQLTDPKEITNHVFMYLLSKGESPEVKGTINKFYEQSVEFAQQWIESGQRHGVISSEVNAGKMSELFTLITLGFRVRSQIEAMESRFQTDDFVQFMSEVLQPEGNA